MNLHPRHKPTERPTPQTTIEAVLYCVRERGLPALKERANLARLMTFDDAAFAELSARIARMKGLADVAA